MIDLNELKRLAEAATPGPWCWDDTVWDYDPKEQAPWLVGADDGAIILTGTIECKMKSNADFIAAANPAAILELIARASAAQDSAPAELPPLPPLPEWVKMDDLAQLVPSEVRIAMRAYGQACADAALADAALSRPVVAIPVNWKEQALRQYRHNDGSEGLVFAYDFEVINRLLAAAPASPQPVAKVLTDTQEAAFELAAKTIELFDDKTMENDYMLDSSECAGIIRALKPSAIAALAAASTPTTLTEKKE